MAKSEIEQATKQLHKKETITLCVLVFVNMLSIVGCMVDISFIFLFVLFINECILPDNVSSVGAFVDNGLYTPSNIISL
jgi:hypothetical protein